MSLLVSALEDENTTIIPEQAYHLLLREVESNCEQYEFKTLPTILNDEDIFKRYGPIILGNVLSKTVRIFTNFQVCPCFQYIPIGTKKRSYLQVALLGEGPIEKIEIMSHSPEPIINTTNTTCKCGIKTKGKGKLLTQCDTLGCSCKLNLRKCSGFCPCRNCKNPFGQEDTQEDTQITATRNRQKSFPSQYTTSNNDLLIKRTDNPAYLDCSDLEHRCVATSIINFFKLHNLDLDITNIANISMHIGNKLRGVGDNAVDKDFERIVKRETTFITSKSIILQ